MDVSPAPGGLVKAPLPERAFALLLDGVAVLLLTVAASLLTGGDLFDPDAAHVLISTAISFAYEAGFLVARSATPGKLLLGLYVGTASGERITPLRAAVRVIAFRAFFVGYLPVDNPEVFTISFFFVSLAMVLMDGRQRRALHDRIAGTRVLLGRPVAKREP